MNYLLVVMALCGVAELAMAERTIVLTSKNTVSLRLPITTETAEHVQRRLIAAAKTKPKEIYLVLNSPGGSIYAGQLIIETARGLDVPVHTISMFSASMSFITSQLLGKRYAIKSATLMNHRAYVSGLEGTVPGSLFSQILQYTSEVMEISNEVAQRSGKTHEQYLEMLTNELWMTAEVAKGHKFIDEIVRIRCDSSLEGAEPPVTLRAMLFELDVQFSSCPLFTSPINIQAAGASDMDSRQAFEAYISQNVSDSMKSRWGANRSVAASK